MKQFLNKVHTIAKELGLSFSDSQKEYYNNKVINGNLSPESFVHEICHYQITADHLRTEPNFGYGSGLGRSKSIIDQETGDRNEFIATILTSIWLNQQLNSYSRPKELSIHLDESSFEIGRFIYTPPKYYNLQGVEVCRTFVRFNNGYTYKTTRVYETEHMCKAVDWLMENNILDHNFCPNIYAPKQFTEFKI